MRGKWDDVIEPGATEQKPIAPLATAQRIYQEHGPSGFYRGVVPALALCSNPAIQFFMYASTDHFVRRLKERRLRTPGARRLSPTLEVFMLSAWAKVVASSITYPLQTIKTSLSKAQSAGGTNPTFRYHGLPFVKVKAICGHIFPMLRVKG